MFGSSCLQTEYRIFYISYLENDSDIFKNCQSVLENLIQKLLKVACLEITQKGKIHVPLRRKLY